MIKKIDFISIIKYIYIRLISQNLKLFQIKYKRKEYKNKKISIAISTNNNFIVQTVVMIKSLENCGCYVDLYLLNVNLSETDTLKIKQFLPNNVKFYEVKINNKMLDELKISEKWPIEAWSRILIPNLIKDDYVLYLDVDCIVVNDISNLIIDNVNSVISGVKSTYYINNNNYPNMNNAVNSGVLIFNNDKLKKMKFYDKCIEYAKKNKDSLIMPDQDTINIITKDVMNNIDPKYNAMNFLFATSYKSLKKSHIDNYYSNEKLNMAIFKPNIIHFNGGPYARPWIRRGIKHPYHKLYKYYHNKIIKMGFYK